PLDKLPLPTYHVGPLRREGGTPRRGNTFPARADLERLEMLKKTYSPKLAEIEHRWYVLDAAGIPLGRLSSLAARLLTGKHKPTYTTHLDTGDFVIVINAEKAVLTGGKEEKKIYHYHTGYPGGLKSETAAKRRQR